MSESNSVRHTVFFKVLGLAPLGAARVRTWVMNRFHAHFQIILQCRQIICLCYVVHLCIIYSHYILRKENLHVHNEERTSSVWHVRGQVPPKHNAFCSFCRQHCLLFFLRHRRCNKNKQTPCIFSRPALTDSKRHRVIFPSVPQSSCMHIHIHIYIYICNHCIKVSECPRVWHTSHDYE